MEGAETWVGLIGGILAIAAVVVSVTRYMSQVQAKAEKAKLEQENVSLKEQLEGSEARCSQLLEQVQVAGEAGQAVMAQRAAVDEELRRLMQLIGASGGSVYIPVYGPRGDVRGLAFLSIEPYSFETQQLRSKLIPIKSLAGRRFKKAESFIVGNVAQDADHFSPADDIASYTPAMTLCHALMVDGEPVGVLQLLSKEGEKGFVTADVQRVEAVAKDLTSMIGSLMHSGDYTQLLSIGSEEKTEQGTVILFNSSLLFKELSAAFALQLLNEYFEEVCEQAFKAGATLDNYTGDGALLRFNVPRRQPDHELAAIAAALEMQRAFYSIREYWTAISPLFADLHHRVGISSGPLLPASLGHSQVQNLTVIGYPIATAAALCDAAPRDRSVILASAESVEPFKGRVIAKAFDLSNHPKASRLTSSAFDITGLG